MKLLIDVDGTLLQGESMSPDAQRFLRTVIARGIDYLLFTNSIAAPSAIASRLLVWGISVPTSSILNPIVAINSYLRSQGFAKAFVVGSDLEVAQMEASHDAVEPQLVVLLDFEKSDFRYSDLQVIYELIQRGLPVIAASASPHYFSGTTKRIDTGAFVALFETLREDKILVFGKPNPAYFREGLRLLCGVAGDTWVIGDDWSTDILGARTLGCRSVLIRSGKYQPGDELKVVPDRTVDRLMELFESAGGIA